MNGWVNTAIRHCRIQTDNLDSAAAANKKTVRQWTRAGTLHSEGITHHNKMTGIQYHQNLTGHYRNLFL